MGNLRLAVLLIPVVALAQEGSASLTGTLVDPAGGYIAHAAVELDSGTRKYLGQADDAGVYKFSNLPVGEYALTFRVNGFSLLTLASIEVSAREQRRIPDIALDVGLSGCGGSYPRVIRLIAGETDFGALAGDVNEGQGTPLEGVEVTLVCRTFSACKSTKTDANGRFSFQTLSPGEYGLSFRREGFYPEVATGYYFRVKAGLESEYGPNALERCPNGNCDPKLRPTKPPTQIVVCE